MPSWAIAILFVAVALLCSALPLAAAEIPLGGVKESGFGREGGQLRFSTTSNQKYTKLRHA